jgi:hypothetical protein
MSGAICAIFMMTFNFLPESIEKALRFPGSWGAGRATGACLDIGVMPIKTRRFCRSKRATVCSILTTSSVASISLAVKISREGRPQRVPHAIGNNTLTTPLP